MRIEILIHLPMEKWMRRIMQEHAIGHPSWRMISKDHAISSDGRVLSFDLALEDRIIKPKMDGGGYLFVRINNSRRYITIRGVKA